MKKIIERIMLKIGNRDGDVYAVKCDNGKYYLVVESMSFCGEEEFIGSGHSNSIEITENTYDSFCVSTICN